MPITIETDPRDTQLRLFAERTSKMRHLAKRIDVALAAIPGDPHAALREELRAALLPNPQIAGDAANR